MAEKEKQLNCINYYGSKARMFKDVIDRIDYNNTRVYIEAFGGGASVLLNKPKHEIEVYNEQNLGVYTLFKVLSDYERGMELRERLKTIEYGRESFLEALAYKNSIEDDDIKRENTRKLNRFILDIEKEYNMKLFVDYRKHYKKYEKTDEVIEKELQKVPLTEKEIEYGKKLLTEYRSIVNGTFVARTQANSDEMDMAMATFIVCNMSRNGLGKEFNSNESREKIFFSKVENLIDVIERLQGVIVLNEDARALLERDCLNDILQENDVDIQQISDWELMYYLDPPYLEDASVTIKKQESGKKSGNPGLI